MAFPSDAETGDTWPEGGRTYFKDVKGRWIPMSGLPPVVVGGSDVATFNDLGNSGTAKTIDVTDHKYQQLTLNDATPTLTITGTPPSGEVNECVLRLVHDATTDSRVPDWAGVDSWLNDTPPFFPSIENGGRCYVTLITYPDGTCEGFPGGSFY